MPTQPPAKKTVAKKKAATPNEPAPTPVAPRPRLRVLHVIAIPVLVWDDGDQLNPGPTIAPRELTLGELEALPAALREHLARLEADAASVRPVDEQAPE